MPRRPRLEGAGALHHVVAKAADGRAIVCDDGDRLRLLDGLRVVVGECGWLCIAYCVLETHAHLVVCTPEPNLGAGMKLLLGRYSSTLNRRLGRRGYVFNRPFWSRRIDKPHYLLCASLYTVLNPVAAGLCEHPRQFLWSSYSGTTGSRTQIDLLAPEILLRTLADEPTAARRVYRELVDDATVRLHARRAEEVWWRSVERAAAETQARG